VTYHCGLGPRLGNRAPQITCDADGCSAKIVIDGLPPRWFLAGNAKPGWMMTGQKTEDGTKRRDYCPRHRDASRIREIPILFSAPMIKAIQASRKVQTRRTVPCALEYHGGKLCWRPDGVTRARRRSMGLSEWSPIYEDPPSWMWSAGTRLWVRETFYLRTGDKRRSEVLYRATEPHDHLTWKPSIFMPRWASRITLEVTDVRIERLHAITEEDARAEGVSEVRIPADDYGPELIGYVLGPDDGRVSLYPTPKEAFAKGWDVINGHRAPWAKDPWVRRVSFRRVEERG
jgi:hypothetical protein